MEENLHTIGEVAKKAQISTRTLRHYEKLGLIRPDYIGENFYRYYEEGTILRLTIIKYFKIIGFSLEEIKSQMDEPDIVEMIRSFDKILKSNEKEIDEIFLRQEIVRDWRRLLEESQFLINNKVDTVSLKFLPGKRLISYPIDFDFEYKSAILDIEFSNFIEQSNNKISGPVMFYFTNIEGRFRIEESKSTIRAKYIQKALKEIKEEAVFDFNLGLYASIYHYGSHNKLDESYKKLFDWQKESGYKFVGPVIERFILDYWSSFDEEKFITEIIAPVEKDSAMEFTE